MPSSKKAKKKVEPSWIPESCSFFTGVIQDALQGLQAETNPAHGLSASESESLAKLQTLWQQKYNAKERQPKASATQSGVQKPAKKKRAPRAAGTRRAKPAEHFVDVNTLEDSAQIVYRIQVPRWRATWPQCRSFDLKITAQVCKSNLIQQLIDWELLDSVMQLPMTQATALFQSRVDAMLATLPSHQNDSAN
ncbi:hypothetical protein KR222_009359 [Zaprionus bogoriensis]|nr:hypothetical protein KR222_009359 [Zaprionus bogoriensis]